MRHEAQVHAIPGRTLRDLGDSILLHDPVELEPFWNRIEAIRWPSDATGFDRRLAEIGVLFASIGRQPHFWTLPPFDEPRDLIPRLFANGFEDVGDGLVLATSDAEAARDALRRSPLPERVQMERFRGIIGADAARAADAIVAVLMAAFSVEPERHPGVVAETLASMADPRFMHYLVRRDEMPVAVARRATFDGISYLSSIGAVDVARGLGFGRFVTASAIVDGFAEGSEWIHLGVYADNRAARRLYESLGLQMAGEPGPDMILIG
ncbi:MAG TPA: GNAT family N-acetyltransferase, partial [Candidatus Limnocylindrales bacterium]|nr:GNAT family N-acetyltransferase [Candidatus Limnocylindrales bacterium]